MLASPTRFNPDRNDLSINLAWSEVDSVFSPKSQPEKNFTNKVKLFEVLLDTDCMLVVLSRAYRDALTQIVQWQHSQLSMAQEVGQQVLHDIFLFQKDMWSAWMKNLAEAAGQSAQHRVDVATSFPIGLKLVGKENGHFVLESPRLIIAGQWQQRAVVHL